MNELPPGRYRHYKGKDYTVLGVSRHSETHEELVVYRQEYGDHGLWVRPKTMFMETVTVDGKEVPRFQRIQTKAESGQLGWNLFHDLPKKVADEIGQTILAAAQVRIERIVSHGHASPDGFWYDQEQHEWVVVLKGAARLRFEERVVEMTVGDFINIPAHKRHRVEWTTPDVPTIWLAVHYWEATTYYLNKEGLPLPSLLVQIATDENRPLFLVDFVSQVLRSGYETNAKRRTPLVSAALQMLVNQGTFIRDASGQYTVVEASQPSGDSAAHEPTRKEAEQE